MPAQATVDPLQVTFRATTDNCVDGAANDTFDMELWNHANTVRLDLAPAVVPDGTSHEFHACFLVDAPRSGLRLKATNGAATSGTVSFTIPTLTVHTDRITDVVKGSAPAGHQLKVRLYDCNHLDFACVHKVTRTVHVNSAGHYSTDMSNNFDAHGFDQARVTYTNGAGHSFMVAGTFDWMAVAPADDFVFGETQAGQKVSYVLRSSPGGPLLKRHSVTPDFGDFSFTFSAPTSTGREVTGDFASDAKLKIPSTHTTKEKIGPDWVLHVRCLPSRKVMVDFNPGPDRIYNTDSRGEVDVDATLDAHDWDPVNEGVIITCQSAAGDVMTRRFDTVP